MNKQTHLSHIVLAAALIFSAKSCAAVCFVDESAKGANTGASWKDAYTHPQYALLVGCTEIWVAKGDYSPSGLGHDPTISFQIPSGTKMYGGFAGIETSIDQRKIEKNTTTLRADSMGTYHVVSMYATADLPITDTTVLDGFTVTGGDARDSDDNSGGGLDCQPNSSYYCSPVLSNLIFSHNRAQFGGAVFLAGFKGALTRSVFDTNVSDDGGAIYLNESSDATISECSFLSNSAVAGDGGAIVSIGPLKITNSSFFMNSATEVAGAIHVIAARKPVLMVNNTFSGNYAEKTGGAIFLTSGSIYSGKLFTSNSIFWANSTSSTSAAQDIGTDDPYDSLIVVGHSVIEHGCPIAQSICFGLSNADPGLSPPIRLGNASVIAIPKAYLSAVDHGDDSMCPTFDQRGVPRPQGLHCDIGAIEWQPSDDIIFRNGFQ